MEEIRDLLGEEIATEIKNLKNLEPGSENHTEAVDNLAKLYKLRIDETKNDWEYSEKYEKRIAEANDIVKDRYIKIGIEAAGIILPMMFYASWMRKGFKFEEEGTFTSTTFKGLFQKFKPTKK